MPTRREDSIVTDAAISRIGSLFPKMCIRDRSYTWDSKWPIKPEILLDGGNMVSNGQDYMSCPPLSVLTTDNQPLRYQFATIWGTSAATAQAAWMAAQLFAEYPGIWPETVRALLVHSARWTQKMVSKYNTDDKKTRGRRDLLRICGYGIPDLNRAIQCLSLIHI